MSLIEAELISVVDAIKVVLYNKFDLKYKSVEIADLREHIPSKSDQEKPWLQVLRHKSTKVKKGHNQNLGKLEFIVHDDEESFIFHNYDDAIDKFLEYVRNE